MTPSETRPPSAAATVPPSAAVVLFYDGVCGLCNRLVRFVLARDRGRRFAFAALQSRYARETLPRHGKDPADLDSVYLLTGLATGSERVFAKSGAVARVLRELPPPWRWLGALASLVPAALLDAAYDAVARRRYRVFGRSDRCELPPAEERGRFVPLD